MTYTAIVQGGNVQTTAAIVGGVAGGIVGGIFSIVALLLGYGLRRRGGIEFATSNWRFTYMVWHGEGHTVTPSRVVYRNVSYQRRSPDDGLHETNVFVYEFTVELLQDGRGSRAPRGVGGFPQGRRNAVYPPTFQRGRDV